MELSNVTLVLVLSFSMFLLYIPRISAGKHVQFEESCGEDNTCDKKKGLICDDEKKICVCSEAASWIKDFGTNHYCRIQEGKKCGISQTSPKCEKGLYCAPVKEGDDVAETICKCPPDKLCTESRHGGHHDDDDDEKNVGKKSLPTSLAGYLTITLHFIYLRYF